MLDPNPQFITGKLSSFAAKAATIFILIIPVLLIGACTGERYTALMRAAQNGDDKAVNRMLDVGASVNERTSKGKTALMLASAEGHDSTVKILLQRGADVFLKDNYNTTALIVAATNNKADVVRTLLKHKADPTHKDSSGGSAISNASFFGHTEVIRNILALHKNLPNKDLEESLLLTAGLGHYDIVKTLLDYGVDINARGIKKRTPVMAAIHFERTKVVKLLVDKGADLKAEDEDGQSPGILARQSNEDILDIINRAGSPDKLTNKPREQKSTTSTANRPAPKPVAITPHPASSNKIPVEPRKPATTVPTTNKPATVKVVPSETASTQPGIKPATEVPSALTPIRETANITAPTTQTGKVEITPIKTTPISPPPPTEPGPEPQAETVSPEVVTGPE